MASPYGKALIAELNEHSNLDQLKLNIAPTSLPFESLGMVRTGQIVGKLQAAKALLEGTSVPLSKRSEQSGRPGLTTQSNRTGATRQSNYKRERELESKKQLE